MTLSEVQPEGPTTLAIELAERGWLPDRVLRAGIRRLVRARLADENARVAGDPARAEAEFAAELARADRAAPGQGE